MNSRTFLIAASLLLKPAPNIVSGADLPGLPDEQHAAPLGQPGLRALYRLEQQHSPAKTTVVEFSLACGPIEHITEQPYQWLQLDATKASQERFRVWLLTSQYPAADIAGARKTIARYLFQEGSARPSQFQDRFSKKAVLPMPAQWNFLFPQPDATKDQRPKETFAPVMRYLGHSYRLVGTEDGPVPGPPQDARVIELLPEMLTGVASNTRQKDEKRRYDNSDYELVRLMPNDYREMLGAGMNCFKVDAEQLLWVQELDCFYWGLNVTDLPYPECLYRSTYLGPTLFLDEPAVGTRDYVIRPRLEKEESFRKDISAETVFDAFKAYFQRALKDGAPQALFNNLKSRTDVDPGAMHFEQQNLFSWETMVSTAAYQLTQDPQVPAAMVLEPPGRIGTRRTVPELDMTYGCQLPTDDPRNLIEIIYGFLRGAARLTGKSWGTSIYGAVDRTDAFWFLTHAYDLGATRFFFWDNYRSACVPYSECLALARNLSAHAESYPDRDLDALNHAAEVAILLPPGYNLGHVQLGKGNLWGLGELNLERPNRRGVKYRVVMSNFFVEIERCLRQGVAFDLLWDLPDLRLAGYREVVHVREDGKVQIQGTEGESLLEHARTPARPGGSPPILKVELSTTEGKAPLLLNARAEVTETSASVYYTPGADSHGVSHNVYVTWELYGPNEEDYRFLAPERLSPRASRNTKQIEAATSFTLKRPGVYRLRAATVDMAGRSTVKWMSINVSEPK